MSGANGGSPLQAWSISCRSAAEGGSVDIAPSRSVSSTAAPRRPSDWEMACRRALCAMPRRSSSNLSAGILPPVVLSVILNTSTAVAPRVWMEAATTETLAMLRRV